MTYLIETLLAVLRKVVTELRGVWCAVDMVDSNGLNAYARIRDFAPPYFTKRILKLCGQIFFTSMS